MQAPHDGARGDARKRHQDPSGAVNAGTPVEPVPAADAAAPGVASPFRTVPNGVPDEAKEPAAPTAVPAAPESDPGDGANGQLSEAERAEFWAIFEDYRRGRFTTPNPILALVERIVREHTERALAEVEQRIASSVSPNFALRHDGSEDPQAAAYVEGLRDAHEIIRAARKEQS